MTTRYVYSNGNVSERTVTVYNDNGWQTNQYVYGRASGDGLASLLVSKLKNQVTFSTYDKVGNLGYWTVNVYGKTPYNLNYEKAYVKYSGYQESWTYLSGNKYLSSGQTFSNFDVNGNTARFIDLHKAGSGFITSQSGQILNKWQNCPIKLDE